MDKPDGLTRALAPLTRAETERLSTPALLARLERLGWCEESAETSELTAEEIAAATHLILFKSDAAWRAAYADLKELLAGREPIP
ncbi:MAG TPA: hypothetical protein VGF50_12470 [Caulobacteraceae bacterium]|jgi:hypothetical protein